MQAYPVVVETREATYAHLEGMAKDSEVFPQPSDLSVIRESDDFGDAAAFAVMEIDVNRVSAETERVNVMLPRWLIS